MKSSAIGLRRGALAKDFWFANIETPRHALPMPTLVETIQQLTEAIRRIVSEAVASNKLVPGEYTAFQWRLREFKYGGSGVEQAPAEGDYVRLKAWPNAWEVLEPEAKALDSFNSVLSALQQAYPSHPVAEWLDALMKALIRWSLTGGGGGQGSPAEITARFLNDLEGGPATHTAQVFLLGVALRSDMIEVGTGVRIRKPQKEEFECPQPDYFIKPFPRFPSAIVEIETTGPQDRSPQLLQLEAQRCVALLRLFRVGSVKYMHYDMRSSSVVNPWPRGRIGSGDESPALETYVIVPEDEPRLRKFWQTMAHRLPKDIYDFQNRPSHTTLAYDRYSDSLLHNGIMERRVANAVMGLEALFLKENQELSYRLGLRVSKLVSLVCSCNPLEGRTLLKDAYDIRSTFAHGDRLSEHRVTRIARKYGSTRKLLLTLLDYLRVALLSAIMSGISKDALINVVDNALLDVRENDRLKLALADTVELFS